MDRRNFLFASLLLLLATAGLGAAEPVRVAVAVSLKEAMTDIAAAYEKEGRGKVELSFGSSGQLQAQIEYGAPVDVFVSAAARQVDELVKGGKADAATRRVIAGNRLVLIVPSGAASAPAGLKDLGQERFKRVAVGEPRTVPAGEYAAQALKSAGLTEGLKGRLVYGSNVRQVLDYVERGEVDAGIVYATDARESGERVRVVETIDTARHDPVEYPAIIVSTGKHRHAAREFLDYLGSDAAGAILARKGFSTPDKQRPRE